MSILIPAHSRIRINSHFVSPRIWL
uniref:Uncharacterized protein n=1 Tax=Anguilla anguilla TaxID=7936 RepID=A0A0E9XM97_ANGAN